MGYLSLIWLLLILFAANFLITRKFRHPTRREHIKSQEIPKAKESSQQIVLNFDLVNLPHDLLNEVVSYLTPIQSMQLAATSNYFYSLIPSMPCWISAINQFKHDNDIQIWELAIKSFPFIQSLTNIEKYMLFLCCSGLGRVIHRRSREDCALVVNGVVYNITHFLPFHPGGDGILTQNAGNHYYYFHHS